MARSFGNFMLFHLSQLVLNPEFPFNLNSSFVHNHQYFRLIPRKLSNHHSFCKFKVSLSHNPNFDDEVSLSMSAEQATR